MDEIDYSPDPAVPRALRPHGYAGVPDTCKICPKPYYARGFCCAHYFGWKETGHPLGKRYQYQQKLMSIPEAPRKRSVWTTEEIEEVLQLRYEGWTQAMISRKTGRSISSIGALLYRRGLEFENG